MEGSDADETVPGLRPDRRRLVRWALGAGLAIVLLRVLVWLAPPGLGAYVRGEIDRHGHRIYTPPFGVRASAVAGVDLSRVHRVLFPSWVLTLNDATTGDRASHERLSALRVEVAKDPNLAALVDELAKAGSLPPSAARGNRFSYLVWAWSEYLDRAGASWRLEPTVRYVAKRQTLYVKAYRVVATVRATLSAQPCRARLVAREDRLNVVEPYLGHTTSRAEGALVILDRTREFAENQVWAMLDEANDATMSSLDAAFAPSVRGEAERALPADARAVLRRTAVDRHALLRTARTIDERAPRCGSLRLWSVPSAGFAEWALDMAASAAAAPDPACPQVTPEEAQTLALASRRVAATTDLVSALVALNGWIARAVTIHELRHAADGGLDGEALTNPCVGCPRHLGLTAEGELSAYLTGLGVAGSSYVSAYQACAGAQEGTAAGAAVAALAPAVLPAGCRGPPPADLAERARRLETRLFGRTEPVSLPEPFPSVDTAR